MYSRSRRRRRREIHNTVSAAATTGTSRRDPAMFEAHLGLGEALRRRGDDEGALREFKIASQIEPSNPRPHYALSQVYRKRDRRELAAQEMATFERLQAHAALEKTRANRLLVPLD